VKFIINTSFDPQFCALSIDNQWQTCFFSSKKKAGQETWEFLRDKNLEKLKLSFIGGVTGPGGFSSLRAASGILESLSLFYKLPIHQISTGEITQELLIKNNHPKDNFILNSFGSGVFVSESFNNLNNNFTKNLIRLENLDEAKLIFRENLVFTDFLPEKKAQEFKNKITINWRENLAEFLYEILNKKTAQTNFLPNYECPPVS
jgi:tRNA A37 threonylcarbamoyladenosine modification protein TsaB